MKFELTEVELRNLQSFLSRVDLKGREVAEFNKILTALGKPLTGEPPKPSDPSPPAPSGEKPADG